MRPIAAHVTSSVICVCVRVGHMGELCKTAEPIEMPFAVILFTTICLSLK